MGSNNDSNYDNNSSNSEQLSEVCCVRVAGTKTTGLFDLGEDIGLSDSSDVGDVGESVKDGGGGNGELQLLNNDNLPTNAEVGMYSFHQCSIHYMEGIKINQQNHKAVELVILVEAGTFVCNMDPMKESKREEVLLSKYMNIINEIDYWR